MTITERLMKRDPQLQLHNEGEWSGTTLKYSAFNDGGIECETGEFLYGLIRLTKPQRILETGTHFGIGASYMALALEDNGFGEIVTIEFLPEIWNLANNRFKRMGFNNIKNLEMDVAKYVPAIPVFDMILLDTEPQTRFRELLQFYPNLIDGGYVFIHDLHRHMHQIENAEHGFAWPYGKIPSDMAELVRTDKLRPFHFGTPRGLTGFYKVGKEDYKWLN